MMNVIGAAVLGKDLKKGPYYGIAGAWCFITDPYGLERALLHYLPVRNLAPSPRIRVDVGSIDADRSHSHCADVYSSLAHASWKSADITWSIWVPVHTPNNVSIHHHWI